MERIVSELSAEGLDQHALGELDSARVTIAKTVDRSVLGCMDDLALTCRLSPRTPAAWLTSTFPAFTTSYSATNYAARGYVPAIDLITSRPKAK